MELRKEMLPVLRPVGGKEEIAALTEVIESGWWGKGPKVAEFEKKFAELVGAKYAIAVTSNSHGQDLVMKALDIRDGDVINPSISFMATAMIPLWQPNITTNVVDVDPYTMCIDPEDVKRALTPNTKAVIAVNQAGVPAPIDKIREFYDGLIIEDCAHSCYTPGAGMQGDIAIWSFQAVKTMPCGDGGMITLNDKALYNKLKEMTWFGVSSTYSRVAKNDKDSVSGKPGYTWDYEVDKIGYKCYMIDINAAICLEQMKKLDTILDHRRLIQKEYNLKLHSIVERPPHTETVQYYCAKVPIGDRDDLIDYLADKNIHTSVHFKPLHTYEIIKKHLTHPDRELPVADLEWQKLISLPVHPGMSQEDIDYVVYWVNMYFDTKYGIAKYI